MTDAGPSVAGVDLADGWLGLGFGWTGATAPLMPPFRPSLLALVVLLAGGEVLAQARRTGPRHLSAREVRTDRVLVTAGVGLVPTFLKGGTQDRPAVQVTGQYYLTERLALGLAYGYAVTTTAPYTDGRGVSTRQTTEVTSLGARVNGKIVRTGPLEVYGGLQLGVNLADATQSHEFPSDGGIADEAAYLAWRTDPFTSSPRQVSATGFFGASVRVIPHAHVYLEAGNNLSLLTAGVELRL